MSTEKERIAKKAEENPSMVFTCLNHYLTEEKLRESLRSLNKQSAVGIDGINVAMYEAISDTRLKELVSEVKTGRYRAPAVKRVYIPKSETEKRPLGIPTTEDKVLQKAIQTILELIYEKTFYEFSYGFRTGKSAHQALGKIWERAMRMDGCWILDIDISKYFDTIDHGHLMEFLKLRVNDGVINRLIGKWLNAGIMEDGERQKALFGTPQGGLCKASHNPPYAKKVIMQS